MKNLYTVLLFCTFSATLLAQELPNLLLEQYPELAALEKDIYDENKIPVPEEYLLSATRSSNWGEYEFEWNLYDSSEYSYNVAGNYDNIIGYVLNENGWEPNRRNLFFYNDNQQAIVYTEQSWVDGEWGQDEGDFQDLRTYDESGNQTELMYQNWIDGEWVTNFKVTNTYYEGTDLKSTELAQSNYGEGLINDVYSVYEEYNANGDLLRSTRQFWNLDIMEWGDKTVFERTYNGNNQLILLVESEESNGILIPKFQTIYTYNDEDFEQERFTQRWDNLNAEWVDYRKNINEYDEDGNWVLYETYFFDSYTQQLEISFRIDFTYFDHGGIDQYIVMVNLDGELVNDTYFTFTYYEDIIERKTYTREVWNPVLNTWQNSLFVEYFYDLFVDTNEQLLNDKKAILLFPNPARNQVNVQLTNAAFIGDNINAQLYNQLGQMVRQYTLGQDSHQMDVAGLSTGSYWLKVSNGEQFAVKKLIVK